VRGARCGGQTHVASGWRRAQVYTLAANKLSATGLWDEAKECYAGALHSLVGSASRHTHAPPPNPAASPLSDTAVSLGACSNITSKHF
jgi:hypothetical protein